MGSPNSKFDFDFDLVYAIILYTFIIIDILTSL